MSKEIFQNRVSALPAFGIPNYIYYVPNGNGDDLDEYLADNNGILRKVRNIPSISVSAGTTSSDLSTIVFSNSPTVTFGLNGNTITASAIGGGGAITDYISIAQSSLFQLAADNSLSLGTTYTTHTHSQYVNTSQSSVFLTSQTVQPVAASGSNGSFLFSTISFGNLNGFSFYTTNGSIVGSYTDGGGGGGDGYNILAAGTQTANVSTTVILSNANNVSFGMAGNSIITASASYSNPIDYISTAQSSLFQLTANMSDYLDTNYTTHTHGDYILTNQSSVFQLTADNSLSLGTGYTTHTHNQYVNTSQSSLFEQTSHTTIFLTNQSNQAYSAGNGSDTFQTLSFADSNGVSFSTGTQGIYATVKTDYQSLGAYLTTAMLSNAGSRFVNTSAGLNLTNISATLGSDSISLSVAAQSVQPVAASASNGSFNFSTLKFVETNGVTWATSTDGIRASVETNYQPPGAYLTTAMASNRGSDFVQATAAFAGTNATGTIASNGISVSVNAQSVVPQNVSLYGIGNTTQNSSTVLSVNALSFNAIGSLTVGYSNGSIQLSAPNALTTAMASNRGSDFVQANAVFNGTNASGTIASNAISVSVAAQSAQTGISSIALSDTTYTSGQISFRDGNGISWASTTGQGISITHGLQFTSNTSAITSNALNTSQSSLFQHTSATSAITSAAVHTSAARIQGIIGSNTTYTSGSVGFRDLNGITWQSTTGQSFQITHDLQYTSNTSAITSNALNTSQSSLFQHTSATSAITSNALHSSASRVINIIAATNSTGGGTASLSSNVSFSNTNNFTFYTSAGGAIVASFFDSNKAGTGVTTAGGTGLSATLNSAGLSVSIPSWLTTARASTDAIGLNTAQSNVTWTANSSGLSLDARGYAGTNTTFAGANISGSMTQNSAGLNLSLSVAAPGAAAENNNINLLGANTAGNTTASGSTIGWSGQGVTLSGTNGSQVVISAPATSSLSATGQVSISVNASTISIGVPLAVTYSRYNEFKESPMVAGEIGQASLHLQPWLIPNLHMDRIVLHKAFSNATNSSNSFTVSDWVGIYTLNVSTLSLLHSASYSTNFTGSGTAGSYLSYGGGIKAVTIGLTQTLTEGMYWIGIIQRTTTGGGAGHTLNQVLNSQINSTYRGIMGAATNATNQMSLGFGVYTVSTSAMPASIGLTQINGNSSVFLRPPSIYFVSGTI